MDVDRHGPLINNRILLLFDDQRIGSGSGTDTGPGAWVVWEGGRDEGGGAYHAIQGCKRRVEGRPIGFDPRVGSDPWNRLLF